MLMKKSIVMLMLNEVNVYRRGVARENHKQVGTILNTSLHVLLGKVEVFLVI